MTPRDIAELKNIADRLAIQIRQPTPYFLVDRASMERLSEQLDSILQKCLPAGNGQKVPDEPTEDSMMRADERWPTLSF